MMMIASLVSSIEVSSLFIPCGKTAVRVMGQKGFGLTRKNLLLDFLKYCKLNNVERCKHLNTL